MAEPEVVKVGNVELTFEEPPGNSSHRGPGGYERMLLPLLGALRAHPNRWAKLIELPASKSGKNSPAFSLSSDLNGRKGRNEERFGWVPAGRWEFTARWKDPADRSKGAVLYGKYLGN